MELVIGVGIASGIFSVIALILSIWNTIEIQAQKRATHTVIPVGGDNDISRLEKELEKITKDAGGNQGDLNRNLFDTGLEPEDLI